MAQQKYSVIQKIDAGGMAEVWKGKATSLRGFEKVVAIKRVLPQLSKNQKFIQMFLDEARLSLYLNHANIVQTFDIGMAESSYFIVMEWIDGANLKGILEIARERGFRIPREQAVFVAIEMCKGLSHAHHRKDPEGKPLAIVHRDISPPNVLISREGEVKLVDFGLAKAASQATFTDPGIVKGKFAYLSPEAALGQPVDFRTDIFATGIVLWEMISGRRLFDGKNDLETVKMVRAAEVPPLSTYNADVEPQLEAILRRALARDPEQRYQSSEQFGHELASYLAQNKLLVTSYDIAVLVKRVLSEKARVTRPPDMQSSGVKQIAEAMQKELGEFRSVEDLDDIARAEFKSVAEVDPDSSLNILPDAINPSEWMEDFGIFDGDETIIDPNLHNRVDLTRPRDVPQPRKGRTSAPAGSEAPPSTPAAPAAPTAGIPPPPVRSGTEPVHPVRPAFGATTAAVPGPTDATPIPSAPPRRDSSLLVGVVLGVLGAVVVVGAAWFIFF
ncbi:MAG: serine/threonine-protein kinase [bacterium]|nr:serine/threonine protein kinase [Myxococcales bacterium]MCB9541985.1 serine/threonine protein kinase [Myxococcales bacterium]